MLQIKMEKVTKEPADIDKKLNKLVFEALGEASTCWESMYSTGQFDSVRAGMIGDKLMEDIKNLIRNK
jgi:hypothetical protein